MSDPKNISRRMTLCTVAQTITNFGPVSRASIAKQTGLSKQTISEIVRQLESGGWVREVGQTAGHIGRRAVTYEIVPDAAYTASVDLGGTKVRVALCNLAGEVATELTEKTHPQGGEFVVGQIARMTREAAISQAIQISKIQTAVVGVPGVMDKSTGRVHMAPNIKGIDQIDFQAALEAKLDLDIVVENDVNLAALGEHWVTHGEETDNIVLLSLGTGIGAGVVIGGQLLRGAKGAAGEIGFLPFGADPFEQESLATGALERVVGTAAICARYFELSGKKADVPSIFDAAEQGDAAAAQVLQDIARYLARTIAAIGAIVDPSNVIMAGSIGARPELLRLTRAAVAECFPYALEISPSKLGDHAALAGGAMIGLTRLHINLFAEGLAGAEIVIPAPEHPLFSQGTI